MLPDFRLERPETVAETVALLGEEALPYCGGTELLLAMKTGLLRPETLVDIKHVAELRGTRIDNERIVIGPASTHADLATDPIVREHLPLLATVEHEVGNARVRAQGSIGGNLCFAEPKSDVTTALTALDASVTLASPRGVRRLPLSDFLLGAYWADREADELLLEITVPRQRFPAVYLKFQTAERPTVGVAAVRGADQVTLTVGAVAEKPVRLDPAADIADAVAAIDMIADLAGTVRYKRHVTTVYARRALAALDGRS